MKHARLINKLMIKTYPTTYPQPNPSTEAQKPANQSQQPYQSTKEPTSR